LANSLFHNQVYNVNKENQKISIEKFSVSERRAAKYLVDKGHHVVLRLPVTQIGVRTSDLLVDGIPYDVYTPKTMNPNRIISAIAKKNSQAQGIVLDLTETEVTLEQLGNVLERVRGAGATNICDIVIIGK
jgi:filamentous hemagglutinin